MTSSRSRRGARTCLLGLALVAANGAASPVSAAAFLADLTVGLVFTTAPGAGLILRGGAGAVLPGCTTATFGLALATCVNATSTIGASTLTFTAGPVDGATGLPFGVASAESHGVSDQVFIVNPGAAAVPFDVNLVFLGELLASAGAFERASASYGFRVTRNGMALGPFTQTKTILCIACGTINVTDQPPTAIAMDVVPAGGMVAFQIDPFVVGDAVSAIPEPSTILLCGVGIVGLLRRFIGSS